MKKPDSVPVHPRFLEIISDRREAFERVTPNRTPPRLRRWKAQQPDARLNYEKGKQELVDILAAYRKDKERS